MRNAMDSPSGSISCRALRRPQLRAGDWPALLSARAREVRMRSSSGLQRTAPRPSPPHQRRPSSPGGCGFGREGCCSTSLFPRWRSGEAEGKDGRRASVRRIDIAQGGRGGPIPHIEGDRGKLRSGAGGRWGSGGRWRVGQRRPDERHHFHVGPPLWPALAPPLPHQKLAS